VRQKKPVKVEVEGYCIGEIFHEILTGRKPLKNEDGSIIYSNEMLSEEG